jgi:hypothetical protein
MSAWATPVGATTQAEFRPGTASGDAWGSGGETQQANSPFSRPVMWGLVLLIAGALAIAAIWLGRHFTTERELAALARVATVHAAPAVPVVEAPASPSPPPVLPAIPAATNAALDRSVPDQPVLANETSGAASISSTAPPVVSPVRPQQNTRKPQTQTIKRAPASADSERAMAKLSPKTREYLYSQAFKRCPAPGSPGALQCRKHICNGAEGGSPACYHINRLKL